MNLALHKKFKECYISVDKLAQQLYEYSHYIAKGDGYGKIIPMGGEIYVDVYLSVCGCLWQAFGAPDGELAEAMDHPQRADITLACELLPVACDMTEAKRTALDLIEGLSK